MAIAAGAAVPVSSPCHTSTVANNEGSSSWPSFRRQSSTLQSCSWGCFSTASSGTRRGDLSRLPRSWRGGAAGAADPVLLYASMISTSRPSKMAARAPTEPAVQGAQEEARRRAEQARPHRSSAPPRWRLGRRDAEAAAERRRQEERRMAVRKRRAARKPKPRAPAKSPGSRRAQGRRAQVRRTRAEGATPVRHARPAAQVVAPEPAPPADWDVVPVFYGTDRVRKQQEPSASPTPATAPGGSSSAAPSSRCPSRTRCPTSSARSPSASPSPTSPSTSRPRTPSSTSPSRS